MQGALQIFISHVTKDEQIASAVKEYLQAVFLNASVFVSKEDLTGGEVWFEQLRAVLASSTAVIGIVTPASVRSTWVHFELGARFTDRHSIPLVGGGVTFESLPAPFKYLQARALDENGLKALARDVARLAEMREPVGFPELDTCLERVRKCLAERSSQKATSSSGEWPSIPVLPTFADLEKQRLDAQDPDLRVWLDRLADRTRRLLLREVTTRSASFEIPSNEELEQMRTAELVALARELGADVPITIMFSTLNKDVPGKQDSEWKKVKTRKELRELERDLDVYEAELAARGKSGPDS